MRRFLISLLAMAALLFCIDRIVGGAMERLFRESPSDDGDLLGRGFARNPDVGVCGDSRAQNHYVVDSLEVMLGCRAYNFGRGGMSTGFQYGVAEMLLKRHVPRVWIMEVEPDIYAFKELTDRNSCFLPYTRTDPVAVELSDGRGRYERIKRWSRMYPYNSLFVSLIADRLGKAPQNRLGYVSLHGRMGDADAGEAAGEAGEGRGGQDWNPPADSSKIRRLREIVRAMRANEVHLLAVRSPEFLRTEGERAYDRRKGSNLARVFEGLGVTYLDIDAERYPQFHDPSLYRDPVHLNERGALIFTRAIADTLRARRWL